VQTFDRSISRYLKKLGNTFIGPAVHPSVKHEISLHIKEKGGQTKANEEQLELLFR
jgi:hypothetical protein